LKIYIIITAIILNYYFTNNLIYHAHYTRRMDAFFTASGVGALAPIEFRALVPIVIVLGSCAALYSFLCRNQHKLSPNSLHDDNTHFFRRLLRNYGSFGMIPLKNFRHVSSHLDYVKLSSFKEKTTIDMINEVTELRDKLAEKDAIIGILRSHSCELKERIRTNKKDSLLVTRILEAIMGKLSLSCVDYHTKIPKKLIFIYNEYLVEAIIQPQDGDVPFAIKFRLYQLVGDYNKNLFECYESYYLPYTEVFYRTSTGETQCRCSSEEVCQTCGSLFFPLVWEDKDIIITNVTSKKPPPPKHVTVLSYDTKNGVLKQENIKCWRQPPTPTL